MSEVVKLDRAAGRRRAKGGRPRPSKTALVLGGGGLTGGVYEIGALRALDLLAVNSTINDFDIYVGTSAGAFIASMTANGITPEEMMRVLNRQRPSPIKELTLGAVLKPNIKGFISSAAVTPLRLAGVLRQIAGNLGDASVMDIAVRLSDALPAGFYTGAGIESYVREALSDPDRTNDFRLLDRELYITATAIDTADRIVFGEGEWADVPISKAVEASGAIPVVFDPVEIHGLDMIDGGIRSTTNVDIAVEAGAEFIIVVNPLVPYINDFKATVPTLTGSRPRKIRDGGMAGIGNQVFRMISHDRLHRAVEEWETRYPGRRHHPDRARAGRRADVQHLDHGLFRTAEYCQARL